MGNKLQINWICLACTAGAPVCFYAVPTSCERDYMVKGEYMNKGDRRVTLFQSIFKIIRQRPGRVRPFFKPLVVICR